jgi:3-hydroxyisobutyrate dehydrogenase-like beta-hydroxyacid dehydrogenase
VSRPDPPATVGIVGLGLLGSAIAGRLRGAGRSVVGYDIVPACVERLVALGGTGAKSAADVARTSDAVLTILPSLATVESAILGADGVVAGARAGQTIVQMSTISPELTRRLDREVTARGLAFLDCPVSGTSGMVAAGNGVFFVGGARASTIAGALCRVHSAARGLHGAAGQAMPLEAGGQSLVALNSASVAEALTMATRGGLDGTLVVDVLGTGAATSQMLQVRGPLMVRGEFPAQMKLDLFMKDLHLIQEAAQAAGAALPLTDVAERLYAATQAAGHGAEDLAVVITELQRPIREESLDG